MFVGNLLLVVLPVLALCTADSKPQGYVLHFLGWGRSKTNWNRSSILGTLQQNRLPRFLENNASILGRRDCTYVLTQTNSLFRTDFHGETRTLCTMIQNIHHILEWPDIMTLRSAGEPPRLMDFLSKSCSSTMSFQVPLSRQIGVTGSKVGCCWTF
jgi:hypothetical protein